MSNATSSFAGHVWTVLSQVNVNEHVEKKGNLSYLSWTWAWSELMARYPESNFSLTDKQYSDGSVEVTCELIIKSGEHSFTRSMWLPVMDNRNKAILNPDARQISDAKMRCLVKTIAISTGLGLYLYAGEDLPQAESQERKAISTMTISKEQAKLLGEAVEHAGRDLGKLLKFYKVNKISELTNTQYEQALHACQKAIHSQESKTGLEQLAERAAEREGRL